MGTLIYISSFLLFLIGLYCVVVKDNLIKIIIGIKIMGYGVCLFYIMISYKSDAIAPIIIKGVKNYTDPLPQALIPAIMAASFAAMILMLATSIRLFEKHKTLDMSKIKELKG
ncbi:MAG TPA: cation:proton antiporter [Elusimicrobia bacterium]|nr:MAG: hypothetical protein A2551_05045 [Elusimicrobia bacterium RIFOXYD2_FULL_34_30]HAM37997.1 cation:proton antiporter [Elusimicrobiota bacterium]